MKETLGPYFGYLCMVNEVKDDPYERNYISLTENEFKRL